MSKIDHDVTGMQSYSSNMLEPPTEFDPPSHPPLITVDWKAFDAAFGFSLPDEYRHHIELKGNEFPLRYTEYEEFHNRRSPELFAALTEHARIIHPKRGPLDPRYVPYETGRELFDGFREWYGEVGYYRTLAVDLDDGIDFVAGIGDLYDAAQALDKRVDWPLDGHPTLDWTRDHDKEQYRDCLSEWRLTVAHDDPENLTSADWSDLPVAPDRIYTPPQEDDQIIFRHERYHRAPWVLEPWDERTHKHLALYATDIGLLEMDTTSVRWLFDGLSTETEIPHRPIEYLPLDGKEAVGFATVYEYENHCETRYLAAWSDTLETEMGRTKARLCRFSSPPTATELKRARALTEIRKQFYSPMFGLDVEFECHECGRQTHWLDITRDDTHSLSLAEKAEHADRHNCGCVVSLGRELGEVNIALDPPDHPAFLSIDWDAFEAALGVPIPSDARYLIERRGREISVYTQVYDDLPREHATEIDAALIDHAFLVHPDRGPLEQQYVPYENARSLFKAFRIWYDDPVISFRPLVVDLAGDEIDFMAGLSDLYDAAQVLGDRVEWPDDGHPTLSYERTGRGNLTYGRDYLDFLGDCQLSASHDDPAVLTSLDCTDLRVEPERIYTSPTENDRLIFRHERYHRVPWAVEPWDKRTHQYLNDHEADVGFLTIGATDWSGTQGHPFTDGEIKSRLVGYVPIGGESPLVSTPGFVEGFATVYEYENHGETRYLAEWPERLEYGGYSPRSLTCQFLSPPAERDMEIARAVTAIRQAFRDEQLTDVFDCEKCGRETHWLDITTDDGEPLSLGERAEKAEQRDCGC